MKNNKRRPFRLPMFVLFFLLLGSLLMVTFAESAWLIAKQDVADALATGDVADAPAFVELERAWQEATVPSAPFPATMPQIAPNPFGVTVPLQIARFSSADPLQPFVEKIRDAKDDKAKQEAIDQAKAALEKHYDKYIDTYEQQVGEMESRLQKLRDQLNKRKEAKDRLVGLKLEMITSQADGIGWPEETAHPNAARYPRGLRTLWRTNPPTPASPPNHPVPREVPAPGAATEPADLYFRDTAPSNFGSALSLPRIASLGPRNVLGTSAPELTVPLRVDTFSTPAVATSGNLETAVFAPYFEAGIRLLEERKYGEFLDRYLRPAEFRKELKSATLDDVSQQFAEKSAESILLLFRSALENPVKTYDPATETLTWEPNTVGGQTKKLTLFRGDRDQWYLSLQEPEQDERQTR